MLQTNDPTATHPTHPKSNFFFSFTVGAAGRGVLDKHLLTCTHHLQYHTETFRRPEHPTWHGLFTSVTPHGRQPRICLLSLWFCLSRQVTELEPYSTERLEVHFPPLVISDRKFPLSSHGPRAQFFLALSKIRCLDGPRLMYPAPPGGRLGGLRALAAVNEATRHVCAQVSVQT